jgi:CubicO group peptidase (beta-lactamase class C family)
MMVLKPILSGFFLSILLFLTGACGQTDDIGNQAEFYTYQVPEQVNDGWATAHMHDVEADTEPILEMMNQYFRDSSRDVHGILIIKNRKLIFEEYFPGYDFGPSETGWRGPYLYFDRNTLHCLHSATKSFTSAMLGISIDLGYISDEHEKMFHYFPEYNHLMSTEKRQITVQHLLAMCSGLEWNEGDLPLTDDLNDLSRMLRSPNPIGYILQKPVIHTPGTTYYYSGGDTNLVGEIVHRVASMNIDYLSREQLFAPLGITNFYWLYFPYNQNFVYCSGDLYLRPRDMAKFGLLFLDGGLWKGNRIISEKWTRISTDQYISLADTGILNADAYAYQWWILDYLVNDQRIHSYSARGWGGQQIIVLPELNAVLVFTGGNYNIYPPVHHIVRTFIIPAIL